MKGAAAGHGAPSLRVLLGDCTGFAPKGALPPMGEEGSYLSADLWCKGCPRRDQCPDVSKLAHSYSPSVPQVPTEKIHLGVQGVRG